MTAFQKAKILTAQFSRCLENLDAATTRRDTTCAAAQGAQVDFEHATRDYEIAKEALLKELGISVD